MESIVWNPWHGCVKYSEGCRYCYVYRRDESVGRDAAQVTRNRDFYLPTAKNRKAPSGESTFVFVSRQRSSPQSAKFSV